jgi:hypothetical protein
VGEGTRELILVADDVGMVKLLHDVYFLVDVFLEEGLLLYVLLAYDLDRVQDLSLLCVGDGLLWRARTTSPKAPFPIDFIIS